MTIAPPALPAATSRHADGWPEDALPVAALHRAAAEITGWPEYAPTPLLDLPGLARRLGVGRVLAKHEGRRFGRGGVKALGAPYGLAALLRARGAAPGSPACAAFTAVAATDGNHGLALAWAARRFGCAARIFVGPAVDAARLDPIRALGAAIVVVQGTYDDAVVAAERAAAADPTVLLVTDTDYAGGLPVTRDIMAGYALAGRETWVQLCGLWPDRVMLQCGVGGLAAGFAAGLWQAAERRPAVVTVEPESAACVRASLVAGRPESVPGDLLTRMAGLACGRPSTPALAVLRRVACGSVTVPEAVAAELQCDLAGGVFGDGPVDCGDTGIAGLAGLWTAATTPDLRSALGLGPDSVVLTVISEGPLPPAEG